MDRREFMERAARGGALALLAGVAGILVSRRQVKFRGECTGEFRCSTCNRLSGCTLPEAVNQRDHGTKG